MKSSILLIISILVLNSISCSSPKSQPDLRGVYNITDSESDPATTTSDKEHYLYIQDSTVSYQLVVDNKTGDSTLTKKTFVTGDLHAGGTYQVTGNCALAVSTTTNDDAITNDYQEYLKKVKLEEKDGEKIIQAIRSLESSKCSNMNVKAFMVSDLDINLDEEAKAAAKVESN